MKTTFNWETVTKFSLMTITLLTSVAGIAVLILGGLFASLGAMIYGMVCTIISIITFICISKFL